MAKKEEKKPAHEVIMEKIETLATAFSIKSFDDIETLYNARANMALIEHLSCLLDVLGEMIIPEEHEIDVVDALFRLAKNLEERDILNKKSVCVWLSNTAKKISP